MSRHDVCDPTCRLIYLLFVQCTINIDHIDQVATLKRLFLT